MRRRRNMTNSDTERQLQDLADRFRASKLSRRQLMQRAGLLLGGSALASFLAACTPAPQAEKPPASPPGTAPTSPPAPSASQPKKGGTLKAAIMAEPPSLDPMFTTATITRNLGSHMFEGLMGIDLNFVPKLDLAEGYEMSSDAKTATITLRKGIPFHNGKEMTSADVIASLKRWTTMGNRGKAIGGRLESIEAKDQHTVVMTFKLPTGQLPLFLAHGEEVIMPEEVATKFAKDQLQEFVGTGPFRFVDRQPDRFTRFVRFDEYVPRPGEPEGWTGRKAAYLDQIDFIPVPEDSVRADGVVTSEYHFGELLNPDSYENLKTNPNVSTYIVSPYYWAAMHFNKKQGLMTDPKIRRAVKLAIDLEPGWRAAWGPQEFWSLTPSMGTKDVAWYTEVTKDQYNKKDPDQAKALLKEAGYNGAPVRWLTTREYAYNYTVVLAAKPQLEAIGMKVDMQLVDWATLVQHRSKPELWDIFITGHDTGNHPLLQPFMQASWPGWWESQEKDRLFSALFAEADAKKSQELVDDMERLVMDEVPYIKIGDYYGLRGTRKELKGYVNPAHFFFWNTWLD
jgi:peptide/nickel transport system substrate-binding protein